MRRLVVDAGSIAEPNRSGVGHTAYRIVEGLANDVEFAASHQIILVVAFNKVHFIDDELRKKVTIRRMFVPGRVMNGLVRYRLLPPMDLLFGKGVYLFPNFKNWPLLFSRSITYVHDVYFKVNPDHIEPRNLSFLKRHVDSFIRRTSRIVTVSEHAKSEIARFFPEVANKIDVVYNGIDTNEFYRRDLSEQAEVSSRYGIEPGGYFIYLSNLEPRKNVGALLEAYKLYVDQTGSTHKLLLVGGMGWKNEVVVERIRQMTEEGYSIIRPYAYVPDDELPALLSGAIALIHPAFYEGFGLSPLQAMACGSEVIVGQNSSLPEVVGSDYRHYVDIRDPVSIAAKMMEFREDGRTLDKESIERARGFTWQKAVTKLVGVIRELEV